MIQIKVILPKFHINLEDIINFMASYSTSQGLREDSLKKDVCQHHFFWPGSQYYEINQECSINIAVAKLHAFIHKLMVV